MHYQHYIFTFKMNDIQKSITSKSGGDVGTCSFTLEFYEIGKSNMNKYKEHQHF
jgi:hypothetical protein